MFWKFLQDWHDEYEDKLINIGVVYVKQQHGFLIMYHPHGEPVFWYDLPEAELKDFALNP